MNSNEILETCLARLTAGDSVETCLDDYPADTEWLRPFLTAASRLHALPPQQLPPAADKAIQKQLRQAARKVSATSQATAVQSRYRRFRLMEDDMKISSRFFSKWLPRVVVAGTAVALLFIFITQFTNLAPTLNNPDTEPAIEAQPSNETTVTTVGDTTITLEANLTADPGEVPLYYARAKPIPDTPEEALAWAQDFGLPNPEVFRPANESDPSLYVMGSDDQQLNFLNLGGYGTIFYTYPATYTNNAEPIPFDEAAAIAVAFLRDHNLLPDAYQVEPAFSDGSPVQQVSILPQVEGGVLGLEAALRITVNPEGQVIHATLSQLTLEPAGTTTIISAQQAYDNLLNGRNVMGSTYSRGAAGEEGFRTYQPPSPEWEVGQSVDLVGYLDVMINAQTGEPRLMLMTADQNIYQLTGRNIDELDNTQGHWGNVHVQGTITSQNSLNRWQVTVENWEVASPLVGPCLIGSLTTTGDVAQFRSEDGIDYILPNAPEEIAEGEQMQICLSAPAEPGSELVWFNITLPPPSEGLPPGAVITEQVAVEQAVEVSVTRVVVESISEENSSGLILEPGAPAGAPGAPPAAFIEPTNPYEIGDEVVLTGIVQLYRLVSEEGVARLEATFANDGDQGEAAYPLTYPLLATPELLEEMAEFNSLHIRVYGRIVPASDTELFFMPNEEQAIEVDSFDRPWPEEKLERFLGHLSVAEIEGQQVLLFTDHATDQQYVINPPDLPLELYAHDATLDEEQILLTGIVHPVNTFGGRPLLERHGTSAGSDIAQATDISQITMEDHDSIPVINEADMHRQEGLGGIISGDVVIERVELVYPYQPHPPMFGDGSQPEPQVIEPVWTFYGRSADGREKFTIQVRATTGN